MQATETTQAQWKAVMGTNPSHAVGDALPVENVSWEDAQGFARRIAEKTKDFGKPGLPTEAEWEYSCRAGTTGAWWFGESESDAKDAAWGQENSGLATHPVGQKKPNAWGLFDMCGNVWEWCEDSSGDTRALRGGCWGCRADCMRSSNCAWDVPTKRAPNIGVRLVLR